ncbi:MAG: hypothetical protein ACLTAS_14345 [Butyribacter sp.]
MAAASNKRMTKEKLRSTIKIKKKMKVFLKAMLQEKADRKLRERELQKGRASDSCKNYNQKENTGKDRYYTSA